MSLDKDDVAAGIGCGIILFHLALSAAFIYAVIHFILKYW